jgi:iron complex transport system substrate-binding protein
MDPFRQLGALDSVRFTGTAAEDWSLPEVREALGSGRLLYAGKYRAPDYELLLAEGCSLAVENTMIFHSPAAKEQLEALGIPVLVERSSYEPHPLGRMEWIKLYGLLVGKAAEAEAFFARQTEALDGVLDAPGSGRTAAFFALSPNGYAIVRRPGDYISRMIELAGGVCVPAAPEAEGALSSANMQLEAFYAGAKDADVLIYNSNVYPMESLAQLLAASELFADFRAVRTGNVWCAGEDLFQETSALAGVIADFRTVLDGTDADELAYLHRLR